MSATDVARRFSEVLNRVGAGEEIEVTRAGAPVALIAKPRVRLVSAERWRDLLASAPTVDERFAGDLREIRASVGPPKASSWPS